MNEIKIWGTSFSLIGDLIMSLPQLTYFKKKYPSSYIYFVIHKKISYCAPLFFNHPLIDNIRISQEWSSFGDDDYYIASKCDILTTSLDNIKMKINDRSHHDRDDWYNVRNCLIENSLMSGINDLESVLSKDELYPKLEMWFDPGYESIQKKGAYTYKKIENKNNQKLTKYISIWPFAAYGRSKDRSPTLKWWEKTIKTLIDKGFSIVHCGYINEPDLHQISQNYKKITDLDFITQIKISLGTNFSIGTDSGSMWVLGAYSHPSIHLMNSWADGHKDNLLAFEPLNKNSQTIFNEENCDKINIDELISLCDNLYTSNKFSIKDTIKKFL